MKTSIGHHIHPSIKLLNAPKSTLYRQQLKGEQLQAAELLDLAAQNTAGEQHQPTKSYHNLPFDTV